MPGTELDAEDGGRGNDARMIAQGKQGVPPPVRVLIRRTFTLTPLCAGLWDTEMNGT